MKAKKILSKTRFMPKIMIHYALKNYDLDECAFMTWALCFIAAKLHFLSSGAR